MIYLFKRKEVLQRRFNTHLEVVKLTCSKFTQECLVSIKGTLANSVDPDQTPLNAASDQDLHCLH